MILYSLQKSDMITPLVKILLSIPCIAWFGVAMGML